MLASFDKPLISMLLGQYKTRISTLACDWGGNLEYGSRYVNVGLLVVVMTRAGRVGTAIGWFHDKCSQDKCSQDIYMLTTLMEKRHLLNFFYNLYL